MAQLVWILPYVSALAYRRDRVPDGLNNDAAEEALRGLYLVGERKLEVITFVLGNSAETFYLYLMGFVARLIGPTTLALQLPSWVFAVSFTIVFCLAARRLQDSLPASVPVLLCVSSVWLFHYARSGLRAIAAPFFLVLFCLMLLAAERDRKSPWKSFTAGAVLGLSLYFYTACRVLPIAFAIYVVLRLALNQIERKEALAFYGKIFAAAAAVSIPNMFFLARHPHEFIFRGSYSVPQDAAVKASALLWSVLFPFHYPTMLTSGIAGRPVFDADGVSNGLVVAGLNPIHPLIAIAFALGLVQAFKIRRAPGILFLIVAYITGTLVLGIAGPSLTRTLILLPVYLLVAALGIGEGIKRFPKCRFLFVGLLALVTITQLYGYFKDLGSSQQSRLFASSVATPMGNRAAALSARGHRVLCVVLRDSNVIRYLTSSHAHNVHVSEFYFRPLVPDEIPLAKFKADTVLIEKTPGFASFRNTLGGEKVAFSERFDEIRLSAR